MGMAPIVLGAVSTVAQMAGQARQAGAQRDQIAAQGRAAEQQYQLQLQRFEYAKNDAAQTYMREALVAEEMRRNTVTQFEMAQVQQQIADRYEKTEADIQDNNLGNRVSQLLATAKSVRGQASLSNAGMYQNLVASMGGNEQAANAFLQNVLAMEGGDARNADHVRQQSLLASVAAYQNTREAATTTERVAGFQAQAQEDEAAITEQYRNLTKQFLDTQRQANLGFQQNVSQEMPGILELQHQRNMEGLNTASFARQAELSLGQQSALIGRGLQQATTQAQMRGLPSTAGIMLGGLAGIAGQTLPFILQNRGGGQQQAGPVGGLNGYTNQYPVIEWGQPLPGRQPAQQVEWGQPLPRPNYVDVTGNIYA